MKRILSISISILIMVIIFIKVDRQQFLHYSKNMDIRLFCYAMLLFIPQNLFAAFRWKFMVRKQVNIGVWESLKLVLSASTLNIFLPSKMGDLCKGYFLKKKGMMSLRRGTNIVLFERFFDLTALGVMHSPAHSAWVSSPFRLISFLLQHRPFLFW